MACQLRLSSLPLLFWSSFIVSLYGCACGAAQQPELEEQTNGSQVGSVEVAFGANGNWLAVAEKQSVVIYDLKGGRGAAGFQSEKT
jgi:hypothetical protein